MTDPARPSRHSPGNSILPLCRAINAHQLLAFDYGDGEREVEPYVHGKNHRGAELLRAYQVNGPSRLGHSSSWRLFQVEQIASMRMLPRTFRVTREDYNPRDPDIRRIHCQIDD